MQCLQTPKKQQDGVQAAKQKPVGNFHTLQQPIDKQTTVMFLKALFFETSHPTGGRKPPGPKPPICHYSLEN